MSSIQNNTPRKIGFELEYPLVDKDTGQGISKETLKKILAEYAQHDPTWKPHIESHLKTLTGLTRKQDGYTEIINTDRGVFTIEFSLRPFPDLHASKEHINKILTLFKQICQQNNTLMLTMGCQPLSWLDQNAATEKDWYLIMNRKIANWEYAVPIAAHQVAIDVEPDEWVDALNILAAFTGPLVALTVSSPIANGKIHEWKEMRRWCWREWNKALPEKYRPYLNNDTPPRPYSSINDYLQFFWNSPLYFITSLKSGGYEILNDLPFIDFLRTAQALGEAPKTGIPAKDIHGTITHITPEESAINGIHQYGWLGQKMHYAFNPQATLAKAIKAFDQSTLDQFVKDYSTFSYLEYRPCGVAAKGNEVALGALTAGIIENLPAAKALYETLTWEEWNEIKEDAQKNGLNFHSNAPRNLQLIARILEIAKTGLQKRGLNEEQYLQPYFKTLETSTTLADQILTEWKKEGIKSLLAAFSW